jgi:hypothetical protein
MEQTKLIFSHKWREKFIYNDTDTCFTGWQAILPRQVEQAKHVSSSCNFQGA